MHRLLRVCFTVMLFLELREDTDFIHAACLILLPCVATLFPTKVLKPLHSGCPPCPSLQALLMLPVVWLPLCALPGTVRWAAAVKGDAMEEPVAAATAAKSLLCHWLGVRFYGSPFLPAWLLRQCPLENQNPGSSRGLWSSSHVASWPVPCQSSK